MGSMTRGEISTEVLENLDNRVDVTSEQMNRWINQTHNHLTHPSVHEFEDLRVSLDITLVSGTASYSLAVATIGFRILAIRTVSYYHAASASIDIATTTRHRLDPRPIEWYEGTMHPAIERPRFYVIGEGQTLLLSGTPNNTNTIRVKAFREAATLDNDTDTTALPEYFDAVLVMGTQAFVEFMLGSRDRANETLQMYNSMIANAQPKEDLEAQNWGIQTSLAGRPHMGVSR